MISSPTTPLHGKRFDLPAQTTTHKDSAYLVNGGIYNYDLLRTLYLIVCPEKVTDAISVRCVMKNEWPE